MPATEETALQTIRDQSTVEPDPSQGETVPVETTPGGAPETFPFCSHTSEGLMEKWMKRNG